MHLDVTAIILAAGEGTRMRSEKSKVLFEIAGRPLLSYPLRAAASAGVRQVCIVASPRNHDAIVEFLASEWRVTDTGARPGSAAFPRENTSLQVNTVIQPVARGTGDAVRFGLEAVRSEWTLILYGDTPLLSERELAALNAAVEPAPSSVEASAPLALLACELENPSGYGRILREAGTGRVLRVVEEKDLNNAERTIREVNAGCYLVRTGLLREALEQLGANNASHEYYLTDVVAFAAERGGARAVTGDSSVLIGVNTRQQLYEAECALFERIAARHRAAGVTVRQGAQIDDTVELAPDVELGKDVVLRGMSRIDSKTHVDIGCVITDSTIAAGAHLKPYTVVTQSSVGPNSVLGPFAHLRPGSVIERDAHIGNFVETKQTRVRQGAKANHLAYLGDADIGERSNIGAGTIVCNYDGFAKWPTTIGSDAFIGSDCQLIAPITIGDGAYVGTGTTVSHDVPPAALALSRPQQVNKPDYAPGLRDRLEERAAKKAGR